MIKKNGHAIQHRTISGNNGPPIKVVLEKFGMYSFNTRVDLVLPSLKNFAVVIFKRLRDA